MSDVGFLGVAGLLMAIGTTVLGLFASFIALIVALARYEGDGRGRRVLRYCAGPLACAALGVLSLGAVTTMSGADADSIAIYIPIVAIAGGVGVALAVRRAAAVEARR
jgi:hypothetical protein